MHKICRIWNLHRDSSGFISNIEGMKNVRDGSFSVRSMIASFSFILTEPPELLYWQKIWGTSICALDLNHSLCATKHSSIDYHLFWVIQWTFKLCFWTARSNGVPSVSYVMSLSRFKSEMADICEQNCYPYMLKVVRYAMSFGILHFTLNNMFCFTSAFHLCMMFWTHREMRWFVKQ